MPRNPRIDATGLLYHVMARGIEKGVIFRDDLDRDLFLNRLGKVLLETQTPIFAFSLIPNHFHLLLRRSGTSLSTVMRRLLTSYAIYFNKRHSRVGHVFQNRYKAIICQDDLYYGELVRYIHLNPLRAGQVGSLDELNRYPYSGHSFVLSNRKCDWFDPASVLGYWGRSEEEALRAYLNYVEADRELKVRENLTGGGLSRSLGLPVRRRKASLAFDERILGEGAFVEALIDSNQSLSKDFHMENCIGLISSVCDSYGITVAELRGAGRKREVIKAREDLAVIMSRDYGLSFSSIAEELCLNRSTISRIMRRVERVMQQSKPTSP